MHTERNACGERHQHRLHRQLAAFWAARAGRLGAAGGLSTESTASYEMQEPRCKLGEMRCIDLGLSRCRRCRQRRPGVPRRLHMAQHLPSSSRCSRMLFPPNGGLHSKHGCMLAWGPLRPLLSCQAPHGSWLVCAPAPTPAHAGAPRQRGTTSCLASTAPSWAGAPHCARCCPAALLLPQPSKDDREGGDNQLWPLCPHIQGRLLQPFATVQPRQLCTGCTSVRSASAAHG